MTERAYWCAFDAPGELGRAVMAWSEAETPEAAREAGQQREQELAAKWGATWPQGRQCRVWPVSTGEGQG